jgi:hypothetical protein
MNIVALTLWFILVFPCPGRLDVFRIAHRNQFGGLTAAYESGLGFNRGSGGQRIEAAKLSAESPSRPI